jgi:putative transposase
MEIRKDSLVNEHYYHIFSRSIAKYNIFNESEDFVRFLELLNLYRYVDFKHKYSKFNILTDEQKLLIEIRLKRSGVVYVEIVAYCVMPSHFHLILKQVGDDGISKYMGKVLNSYSKYFNIKHRRSGPLWSGRFKNILVESDEQLLHVTRYLHLNPTSAGLVANPFDWPWSSLVEYMGESHSNICNFDTIIDMPPKLSKKFVLDHKGYQRDFSIIKSHLIDNYSG